MNGEFSGESSSSQHSKENCTDSDVDPPKLKKARFIWEVKGNYHLKNTSESSDHEMSHPKRLSDSDQQRQDMSLEALEGSPNISPNVLQGEAGCCLQSFIDKSHRIIERLNNEEPIFDDESSDDESTSNLISPEQAFFIRYLQWHAKRMVRYDMENRINSIVEEVFENNPERHRAINISDLVEDAETDMDFKDESILMAIESHGLRKSSNHSVKSDQKKDIMERKRHIDPLQEFEYDMYDGICYDEVNSAISDDESSTASDLTDIHDRVQNDFLDSAVSAAIFQKGLSHSSP